MSCWRRCKGVISSHARDCKPLLRNLQALFPCAKGSGNLRYQQLVNEHEKDDKAVAELQREAECFGKYLMYVGMLGFFILTFQMVIYEPTTQDKKSWYPISNFERDRPILLCVSILEVLFCGAVCRTAAILYRTRKHAQRHPSRAPLTETTVNGEKVMRKQYTKIGPLMRDSEDQLWGFTYRPSTDGLEALIVEDVIEGSPVDRWNAGENVELESGSIPGALPPQLNGLVAICSVNDHHADVAMMQRELLLANEIVLYCRPMSDDPAEFDIQDDYDSEEMLEIAASATIPPIVVGSPANNEDDPHETRGSRARGPQKFEHKPQVASISLEDEDPTMMVRWCICGMIFGWVTLIPVLLMNPHPERPRQALYRAYLWKISTFVILPLWILLWLLDSFEILFSYRLMPPWLYFIGAHMVLASLIVFVCMKIQRQDEITVLEQRAAREAEVDKSDEDDSNNSSPDDQANHEAFGAVQVAIEKESSNTNMSELANKMERESREIMAQLGVSTGKKQRRIQSVAEEPQPLVLRELLIANPIAIVWIGVWLSIPLVLAQAVYPLQTDRGKLAQTYTVIIFGCMVMFQLVAISVVSHLTFDELPTSYLHAFMVMVSLPCLCVWCLCLCCSSQYARADMRLVKQQREKQAKDLVTDHEELVLHESLNRDWTYCSVA